MSHHWSRLELRGSRNVILFASSRTCPPIVECKSDGKVAVRQAEGNPTDLRVGMALEVASFCPLITGLD